MFLYLFLVLVRTILQLMLYIYPHVSLHLLKPSLDRMLVETEITFGHQNHMLREAPLPRLNV
jgi:hypothetical protein